MVVRVRRSLSGVESCRGRYGCGAREQSPGLSCCSSGADRAERGREMNGNDVFGVSIPFRFDANSGGVITASGSDKLKENIAHILLTGLGERVMRRGYAAGLRRLVPHPSNHALLAIVQRH